MKATTTRRQLLAAAASLLLTPFAPRALRRGASNNAPRDVCFWRREQGPVCINGEIREYWCSYCCAGTQCELLYCEWRVVGAC